ncbi:hypothetical protein [Paenibacillus sp. J2TS4]|uniref:hypothetical protein n=1 Tax=Paenibacillus sp. J2TS4 TaxID=2807194 RepID=UPI001BCA69F0|nr:hypothetical protein [Paenibacillus sp. J2TS4]
MPFQSRLEHAGFYPLEAKIEEVAAGLGLAELGIDREVDKLSGWQRVTEVWQMQDWMTK